MKKLLFSVLSLLMLSIGMQAQTDIANYKFTSSAGTYVPLTGATTYLTAWDNQVSAAIPLGGTFTYGTASFTDCYISANGFISFGSAPSGSNYTPLSTGTYSGAISAFAQDAGNSTATGATPSISYMNIGGASGEFVVQYTDHANYFGRSTERLNFQIRLNLATGAINIVYGSWTAAGSSSSGINSEVGIRGNSTTWNTNVNSLSTLNVPTGTSCNWANAVNSNVNSSTMLFSSANVNITPSNGLMFTWTPPVNATLAPVRSYTTVTGITASGATINWTAPTGATQYNVQYRTPGSCSWTNFSGNPVTTNSVTLTGLAVTTAYQVRVQSSDATNNAIWSHIPNAAGTGNGYSTTGTFSTLATCPVPTALNTSTITGTAANFTWTAGGTEGAWDVYYGPQPLTAPTASTAATATTATNSYSATGLASGSPYSVYVRANCGAGDVSTWAAVKNFNTVITCTVPTAVTISNITSTSATFSWISVATAFDVYYGSATTVPNATTVPTATTATNSYSATGLTSATAYSVYVRANCGAGDLSTWTAVKVFNTACNATNIPYLQDFESVITPAIPGCTSIETIGGSNAFKTTSPGGSGFTTKVLNYSYNSTNAANAWFYTQGLNLTQGVSYRLTYKYGNNGGSTYVERMKVNYGMSPVNTAMTNTLTDHPSITNNVNAITSTVDFTVATTGVYYIGYNAYSIADRNSLYVDDISVNLSPSCIDPSGLNSSAITPTSANYTWTAGGTETAWDVYYGIAPLSAPNATTVPTATTSTTSYSLSGLTPSTSYNVYVRSNCGGSTSVWTLVSAFMTPCLPPNITGTMGSTRCGIGTTTLSVMGDLGATFQWYTSATGGSAIATGSLITTPTISATTNYYVSAANGLVAENVGRATAASTSGFLTTPNWGIVFNTTNNTIINSVTIYPTGTGSVTIALLDATGTELASTASMPVTGSGVSTPVVVNLGFNVPIGNDFKIVLKAYTGITDLIRDSGGSTFPYTSTSGAVSVTGGWTGTGTSTSYYWFYNLNVSSGCESARSMVTATVTAPAALTVNAPSAVCGGNGIASFSVTSTLSNYDSYVWTPTTGLYTDAAATTSYTGGNASMLYVNSSNSGVLSYNVNANNSVSGCATAATATVSILDAPTSITVTGTPNPLCAGSTVSLSANPNALPIVLLNENFNAATNNWTTVNSSAGGTAAAAAWTLQNSPYTSNVGTGISSNDASQFYLTDSDAQGSGGTTNTTLQSPAINTTGLTSLSLNFYHYYHNYSSDVFAKVEVSTDGTTWTSVKDYSTGSASVGTATSFSAATINLNAYVGNATLYVRYNYSSAYGYGWAIDNVKISGTTINNYGYSWTSNPAGFTSTSSMGTDMPTATTDYSVVVTNTTTSCSNSAMVTVSVNPVPTVTASASSASVCAGSSATLTAGGATNYTWTAAGTSSTQVVTPITASVYTVTGEALGCSNTATVSVGVNAVPSVTASASSTVVCVNLGESTLLTWTDGVNTMTTSVTPTVPTTYTLVINDGTCNGSTTIFIDAQVCTSVSNLAASATGINVYPNPTNGILNISIATELADATSFEVYDAIGKLVIKETLSSETTTINTTKLTAGIYVYKVINNNQAIKIGKIVKQ